jgi:aryl-alcohol dehydrogenase-like predicted oxidoreductase
VAGLGCGGNAQLGLGQGKTSSEAIALVRRAIELGVNYFDTSEAYATEPILGAALTGVPTDQRVICTKSRYRDLKSGVLHSTKRVLENLEQSLRKLSVERVELYLIHGLLPEHYDHVRSEVLPALMRERDKGKIGHLGISEFPYYDTGHATIKRALADPAWDVIMVGFHMLHQGASREVFPETLRQTLGTVVMYAVRDIFSQPGALQQVVRDLAERGLIEAEVDARDPLGFLLHEGGAGSVIEAAYRYARHQPGAQVVLFGTGSLSHLQANIDAILKPPLPAEDVERLTRLFGHLTDAGLELPAALRDLPQRA